MAEIKVDGGGVELAVEEAGEGIPVVLLHGLTATRRYVVMGSRSLERSGHRVIAYDARGHGRSSPAPSRDAYTYDDLGRDLIAVLDDRGVAVVEAGEDAQTVELRLERPVGAVEGGVDQRAEHGGRRVRHRCGPNPRFASRAD